MTARLAIVGAGPAGSALALGLVARGVAPSDLVVFDRAHFPRPKLCGGGVTVRGTERLASLLGDRPHGGCTTRGLEFVSEVGRIDVRERGPQWVFDRASLDAQLLDAVRAAGVEVREGADVTALEPGVDGWRLRVGRGVSETFRWIAGADGATSFVRRASGLGGGRVGRLVEAVFEATHADVRPDTLVFDFDPILDGIPGYAWIFPDPSAPPDAARFKLGVMDGRGRVPGDALRRWTRDFAARRGFRLAEPKIAGWPERFYDRDTRGHRPGLVLVGEAFGIDALLGEGIAPALFHADYAAGRLREALDRGSSAIPSYEGRFLRSEEGRNLWFQARLADRLYGAHPARWLRVLFGMEHLGRLAGAGQDAYGRLFHHIPALVLRYGLQVLRRGFPAADLPARRLPAPAEREQSASIPRA